MFLSEFCKTFKNTCLIGHLRCLLLVIDHDENRQNMKPSVLSLIWFLIQEAVFVCEGGIFCRGFTVMNSRALLMIFNRPYWYIWVSILLVMHILKLFVFPEGEIGQRFSMIVLTDHTSGPHEWLLEAVVLFCYWVQRSSIVLQTVLVLWL